MKEQRLLQASTVSLDSLRLTNFRNFNSIDYKFKERVIAFIGNNGLGKTNLLEAISLAAPGRGLRNSKLEELENCQSNKYLNGWNVTLNFSCNNINYQFQTSKTPGDNNRSTEINGNKISKQAELGKYLNIIWLTPIYDSIFISAKSDRRKFFDRIVFNLFPEHLQNLQRYEHYQRERLQVILNTGVNNRWLDTLEKKLSELNSSISAVRVQTIKYLNAELSELSGIYPKALLFFTGVFENLYLDEMSSKEVEEKSLQLLKESRLTDLQKKQTSTGIHKTDFKCIYEEKNMDAALCSTGEQKSLLLSVIMAQAKLLTKYNGRTPVLLLDEITSHLDKNNSKLFIEDLKSLKAQCFMTGTNQDFFNDISDLEIIQL